jgi:hypothetical protein
MPISASLLVFSLPFSVIRYPKFNMKTGAPFRHRGSACLIIPIAEKGFLPTISTLDYGTGKTRRHYSRHSCHTYKTIPLQLLRQGNRHGVYGISGASATDLRALLWCRQSAQQGSVGNRDRPCDRQAYRSGAQGGANMLKERSRQTQHFFDDFPRQSLFVKSRLF